MSETTSETTATAEAALAEGTKALAVGALACPSCGQRVDSPHWDVEQVAVMRPGLAGASLGVQASNTLRVRLSRCGDPEMRLLRAARLLDDHLRTQHRIGSRGVALHQAACALDALAALGVLGHRTLAVAGLTRCEGEFRRLLEHLTTRRAGPLAAGTGAERGHAPDEREHRAVVAPDQRHGSRRRTPAAEAARGIRGGAAISARAATGAAPRRHGGRLHVLRRRLDRRDAWSGGPRRAARGVARAVVDRR